MLDRSLDASISLNACLASWLPFLRCLFGENSSQSRRHDPCPPTPQVEPEHPGYHGEHKPRCEESCGPGAGREALSSVAARSTAKFREAWRSLGYGRPAALVAGGLNSPR